MSDFTSTEIVLTKFLKPDADRFMSEHPQKFEEVAQLMFTDVTPICWRAAWLISAAMKSNDPRLVPFIDPILEVLPHKLDGHQRELLKVLEKMHLSENQESVLYDECVTIWEAIRKKPATRYFAFRQMVKMVEKYPELINEIHAVTQTQYINTLSPGIKRGVMKLIYNLKNSPN